MINRETGRRGVGGNKLGTYRQLKDGYIHGYNCMIKFFFLMFISDYYVFYVHSATMYPRPILNRRRVWLRFTYWRIVCVYEYCTHILRFSFARQYTVPWWHCKAKSCRVTIQIPIIKTIFRMVYFSTPPTTMRQGLNQPRSLILILIY